MTTATATIAAGSIFSSSWGYEQTNVTFYRVVKATAKMVTVQEVGSLRSGGEQGGTCVPTDAVVGQPITRKIDHYSGRPGFRATEYEHATLWDGRPERFTSGY